ncbi:hypothetical protein FB451DRAFT_47326 [Mycena latifolia]|nr:hypothetical protein FB451DRAFT_47326 [Mycena latifolia]
MSASNTSTSDDRIHPCFRGDPLPASAEQPDITTKLRYFIVDSHISNYLYDIAPSPGKLPHVVCYHVPFYQVSGRGPPPADLTGANLGDVYIDISPSQHGLYGKVADGSWKRWYDPQPWDKTDENIVRHPHFASRKLWCSSACGISWYTANTVRNNQERARKHVSRNADKTEEMRWREASVLIKLSLVGELKLAERKAVDPPPLPRWTTSCSPPFESRDVSPATAPVLGKRKAVQHSDGGAEVKLCKAALEQAVQRLKEESEALEAKNSALEAQHASHSDESQQFSEWADKILEDSLNLQDLAIKNQLGANCRDYLDVEAALAAAEVQLAQEESRLADAHSSLSRAVAKDAESGKQFDLAAAQLRRTLKL